MQIEAIKILLVLEEVLMKVEKEVLMRVEEVLLMDLEFVKEVLMTLAAWRLFKLIPGPLHLLSILDMMILQIQPSNLKCFFFFL